MVVDRLRYFSVVASTQNMRKAAELLHISPAALSKSIKVLEDELKIKLIAPSGRGIIITDNGIALANRAQHLLNEIDRLVYGSSEPNLKTKPLKIGSFEVFTTHALGPLQRILNDISINLFELIPGEIEQRVAEGKVDLGITYIPIPTQGVEFLKVTQIEMGIFVKNGTFEENTFADIPFVVPMTPIEGAPSKMKGLDGWPDHVIQRNIKYRVTMMESALELCRQGYAAVYLPTFIAYLNNQKVKDEFLLAPFPLPTKMKAQRQEVYLVKRQSAIEGSIAKKVAKALRIICNSSKDN